MKKPIENAFKILNSVVNGTYIRPPIIGTYRGAIGKMSIDFPQKVAPNNIALGIYGPYFWKYLIDTVWCDNVGTQMHSNSANMLHRYQ